MIGLTHADLQVKNERDLCSVIVIRGPTHRAETPGLMFGL